MGVRAVLAAAAAAAALAGTPLEGGADYLAAREVATGGFAEPGRAPSPALTAWAVLGLRAAGREPSRVTRAYLAAHEDELRSATDVELAALATPTPSLLARVRALARPSGAIGPTLNSTYWGILALRGANVSLSSYKNIARFVLEQQRKGGGWSWAQGVAADSNDTAAAIQALRSLGVSGRAIRRGLAFLRRCQNDDGGFALVRGRASDAQSTGWAIQAYLAAGAVPPRAAFRFLARMRRADGSFRYSARFAVTPVWVTAQVLPALAGRPFPLR